MVLPKEITLPMLMPLSTPLDQFLSEVMAVLTKMVIVLILPPPPSAKLKLFSQMLPLKIGKNFLKNSIIMSQSHSKTAKPIESNLF
jgi:hypothetical protein